MARFFRDVEQKKSERESESERGRRKNEAWAWLLWMCCLNMRSNAIQQWGDANEKDKRKSFVKMCAQLNRTQIHAHKSIWHAFGVHKHEPKTTQRVRGPIDENNMNRNHITAFNRMALHTILGEDISLNEAHLLNDGCVCVCIAWARDSFWQIPIGYSLTLIHWFAFIFILFFISLPTLMKDFCNR